MPNALDGHVARDVTMACALLLTAHGLAPDAKNVVITLCRALAYAQHTAPSTLVTTNN